MFIETVTLSPPVHVGMCRGTACRDGDGEDGEDGEKDHDENEDEETEGREERGVEGEGGRKRRRAGSNSGKVPGENIETVRTHKRGSLI